MNATACLGTLEGVFGWLLAASWQASVLALIVLALQAVLRGRLNPRWRYALWLLVVLRLMMPALPESALSLFQFAPAPSPVLLTSVREPLFAPTAPIQSEVTTVPLTEPGSPLTLYSLLALGWLAGAVLLLILTWEANRRFARQVARSPEITDPALLDLFLAAKTELEVRRSIRLVENGQVQSPAIMGLFSPTLLLPGGVRERFDATELRLIFLHELAHLKRGDVIVQGLIALLQILHWFNPVLWYAFRRMRIDREPATDALVLSRAGEAEKERYGLMLIKLLEHFNQRHSLPTLVGILEDKDQFKRRFSLIAKFTRSAYGWSLLGILLIGILSVVCLTKSKPTAIPSTQKIGTSTKATDTNAQMLQAVHKGDTATVQKLIDQGVDPKTVDKDGRTLLFDAGSPEVAELLIQHGVDVKARVSSGDTALNIISFNGGKRSSEVARVLLQHGADVNATSNFGETPIMFAQNSATVDVLVQFGADLKAKDKMGLGVFTSHFIDSNRDVTNIYDALLRHGAPFDLKVDGSLLMIHAVHDHRFDVMQWLLNKGVDPNTSGVRRWDDQGKPTMIETPMQEAVNDNNYMGTAEFLFEHGAKADDQMSQALLRKQNKLVKFFWEHGAHNISELCYAISQDAPLGDLQKLLDQGSPADPPQDTLVTPVREAALQGNLAAVKLLVQHGADIKGDPLGKPNFPPYRVGPLSLASSQGQDEIVEYLLQQGAPPTPYALYGAAGFSWGARFISPAPGQPSKDHFEKIVRILIDAGALKTVTPEMAGYILFAGIGNLKVLKMLLDAGLSPEAPMPSIWNFSDKKNDSVIGAFRYRYRDACQKSKNDPASGIQANVLKPILDMLEAADKGSGTKTTSTDAPADDANTQMLRAVQKGDAATVQKLIDQGVDPKTVDKDGRTLLFEEGSPEVVEILIAHGVDPNARDKSGNVALFNLCQNGSKDVTVTATVRALLEHGADFDPKGQSGAMALGYAAAFNDVKLMKFLMDRGVSPNAHGAENQDSPLGMAAFRSPEAVKLLLERGADPEGYSREGTSPLADAIMFNKTENANLLRAAGAHDVGDLSAAVAAGDNAKVTALLHDGANVNETDRAGNTPLLYAVRRGQVDMAKLLLAHGANINQFSFGGLTPTDSLYLEANSVNPDQTRLDWGVPKEEGQRRLAAFKALFLKYPPDPNYRDSRGRTALHQAAFSGNMFLPMGDKAHPVNPNIQDHDGNTPLLLAALSPHVKYTVDRSSNSQTYIVNWLLKAGAKLDLVMANGKTVGEMAMAAAVKANNPQLISVLHDAGVAEPASPPESPDQRAGTKTTNADAPADDTNTPMPQAVQKGDAATGQGSQQDLATLKKYLLAAKEDADARRVLLDSVKNLPDDQLLSTLQALGRSEPDLVSLQTEIANEKGEIESLLNSGQAESSPTVQAKHTELAAMQQQMRNDIAGLHQAIAIDALMATSRVKLLTREVNDLKLKSGETGALPPPNAAPAPASTDLPSLKKDLLAAKEDDDARRVLLDSVKDLPDDQFLSTLQSLGRSDSGLTSLQTEIDKEKSEIEGQIIAGPNGRSPAVQAKWAELAAMQRRMIEIIVDIRRTLVIDEQTSRSRVILLTKEVNDLTAKTQPDSSSNSKAGADSAPPSTPPGLSAPVGSSTQTFSAPRNEAPTNPTLNIPKLSPSLPLTLTLNGGNTISSNPYFSNKFTLPNLPPPPDPNPNNTYTYHSSVTVVTRGTPLDTSVSGGDKDANATNTVGNPALAQALVTAAKQGDLAEVERLLKQGAKAGQNDVLTVAAAKNQKLVQLLRQYNALPISDLAWAVLENRPMDEILGIEEKEAKGLPFGKLGFIQVPTTVFHPTAALISHGFRLSMMEPRLPFDEIGDLSILDDASLPLPVAALMGDLPTVELLVQNGVKPNALPWPHPPNPWLSVSPLSLAAFTGHDDMVAYLLQHGAQAHFNDIACPMEAWPSPSGSKETRENTVKLLIAAGALKNITEEQTVLLFELSFHNPEENLGAVKLLLDAGLNPNARSNGKTVFEIAKEWNNRDDTKPLLELLEKAVSNAGTNQL